MKAASFHNSDIAEKDKTFFVLRNNTIIGVCTSNDSTAVANWADETLPKWDALTTEPPADATIGRFGVMDTVEARCARLARKASHLIEDSKPAITTARKGVGKWLQSIGSRIAS